MKKTLQLLIVFLTFSFANAQQDGDVFTEGNYDYEVTDGLDKTLTLVGFTRTAVNDSVSVITNPVTDIIIPETVGDGFVVTEVATGAFSGNPGKGSGDPDNKIIETVSLSSTVTIIGAHAFRETNIKTINLENVEEIGGNCFTICRDLEEIGSLENIVTLGGYPFFSCHKLKVLEIPLVTVYEDGIAYDMDGLREFNIPNTVTEIKKVFGGRNPSTFVQMQVNWANPATDVSMVPDNFLRQMYANADGSDDGKGDYVEATGVVFVRDHLKLYVPVGTKALYEDHEFWGRFPSANIIEGDMPELTISTVGNVFTEDDIEYTVTSDEPLEVSISGSTLAALTIPATITNSEDSTVYNVVAVGKEAFLDNTNVVSVELPSSVKTIYQAAFQGATNLETINLEYVEIFSGQNVFFNVNKLTTANLSALKTLGNFAFHGVGESALTTVNIPSAETLGKASLSRAKITTINIPATVHTIGDRVFWNCTELTDVSVNWLTAEAIPIINVEPSEEAVLDPADGSEVTPAVVGNATFLGVDTANVNLLVPIGTKAFYEAIDGWNTFNIVETEGLSAEDIIAGTLDIQVTSDELSVNSNSTFTNGSLTIYDITGKELASTVLNGASDSVNISSLTSGIYIVKVTEGNTKLVKRFVKQ